jgi:hypothetical protein
MNFDINENEYLVSSPDLHRMPKKRKRRKSVRTDFDWSIVPGGKKGVQKLTLDDLIVLSLNANTETRQRTLVHAKRMIKNRLSAKKGRQLKKLYIKQLEDRVQSLEHQVECLESELSIYSSLSWK